MANDLTGDFDLVAEFAIPAVNRVLAAMHARERFLHAVSMRVDDTPRPTPNTTAIQPSVLAAIDAFGDPTVNHDRLGQLTAAQTIGSSTASSSNLLVSALDAVVNFNLAGIEIPPVVPSHLKGRAQLQIF